MVPNTEDDIVELDRDDTSQVTEEVLMLQGELTLGNQIVADT